MKLAASILMLWATVAAAQDGNTTMTPAPSPAPQQPSIGDILAGSILLMKAQAKDCRVNSKYGLWDIARTDPSTRNSMMEISTEFYQCVAEQPVPVPQQLGCMFKAAGALQAIKPAAFSAAFEAVTSTIPAPNSPNFPAFIAPAMEPLINKAQPGANATKDLIQYVANSAFLPDTLDRLYCHHLIDAGNYTYIGVVLNLAFSNLGGGSYKARPLPNMTEPRCEKFGPAGGSPAIITQILGKLGGTGGEPVNQTMAQQIIGQALAYCATANATSGGPPPANNGLPVDVLAMLHVLQYSEEVSMIFTKLTNPAFLNAVAAVAANVLFPYQAPTCALLDGLNKTGLGACLSDGTSGLVNFAEEFIIPNGVPITQNPQSSCSNVTKYIPTMAIPVNIYAMMVQMVPPQVPLVQAYSFIRSLPLGKLVDMALMVPAKAQVTCTTAKITAAPTPKPTAAAPSLTVSAAVAAVLAFIYFL